jgi:thiol-disulfide isomerase/thioredoxin
MGEFTVLTVDGDLVSKSSLTGTAVLGFLTPECGPCQQLLPQFIESVAALSGGRRQALVVVVGSPAKCGELACLLSPISRVVVESPDGPVQRALGVSGYPAFAVVDEQHTVVASGTTLDVLQVPVDV